MYNSDYNRPPEEREPIETEHFHVWDAESPKPPRKKSGAARFVALGLCCALVGGLVGLHLGVNLVNALVLGVLGVPGFGLLLMLNWALAV